MSSKKLTGESLEIMKLFKSTTNPASEDILKSFGQFLIKIEKNPSQKRIFKNNLEEFIETPLFCITCRKLSTSSFVKSFKILKDLEIPENIFNFIIYDENYLNVFFEEVLESCGETIDKNCVLSFVGINISEQGILNYFNKYIDFLVDTAKTSEISFNGSTKKFFKKLLTSEFYNFKNISDENFFDFYIRIFDNNLNSLINMALSEECTANKQQSMMLISIIIKNILFEQKFEGTIAADSMVLILSKYQYIVETLDSEILVKSHYILEEFFSLKYDVNPFVDLVIIQEENIYKYLHDFQIKYCYIFPNKLKKFIITSILIHMNLFMIPFESFTEMVNNNEIDLNMLPLWFITKLIGDDFKKFSQLLNYPEIIDVIKMFKFDEFKRYPYTLGFLFRSSKIEDEFLLNFASIDPGETVYYRSVYNKAFKLEFPNLITCKRFITILKKICKTQSKNQVRYFLEDFTDAPVYLNPIIREIYGS